MGNFLDIFQELNENKFQYEKQIWGVIPEAYNWRKYVFVGSVVSSYKCNEGLASPEFSGTNFLSPGRLRCVIIAPLWLVMPALLCNTTNSALKSYYCPFPTLLWNWRRSWFLINFQIRTFCKVVLCKNRATCNMAWQIRTDWNEPEKPGTTWSDPETTLNKQNTILKR